MLYVSMDLGKLFNSQRRAAVLQALSQNQNGLTASEIAKEFELDLAGVTRELKELHGMQLIESKNENGRTVFAFKENENNQLLKELILKSCGLDEWRIWEELPNGYYPYQVHAIMDLKNINQYMKSKFGETVFTSMIFYSDKRTSYLVMKKSECVTLGNKTLEKLLYDQEWLVSAIDDGLEKIKVLQDYSIKLKHKNISALPTNEIINFYLEGDKIAIKAFLLGWIQNGDSIGNGWTDYFIEHLKKKIKENMSNRKAIETFTTLISTTEKTLNQMDQEDLLIILKEINSNAEYKSNFQLDENKIEFVLHGTHLFEKIRNHAEKYGFLTYGTSGPGNSYRDYIKILAGMLKQNLDSDSLIEKENKKIHSLKKEIFVIEKELKLAENECSFFKALRYNIWMRAHRKNIIYLWWSAADMLLVELARRYNLSVEQIRTAFPNELKQNKPNPETLTQRTENFVMYTTANEKVILHGLEARKFVKKLQFELFHADHISDFYGTCACPGLAKGAVKIINNPSDMNKMKEGDILVSNATMPDLMPAIRMAAAIVTNQGGITCHAAIVSRELGIPCVIGTNKATKVLKDGDLVEVNASHGRVKLIKQ